jgi:hypothetical protein
MAGFMRRKRNYRILTPVWRRQKRLGRLPVFDALLLRRERRIFPNEKGKK